MEKVYSWHLGLQVDVINGALMAWFHMEICLERDWFWQMYDIMCYFTMKMNLFHKGLLTYGMVGDSEHSSLLWHWINIKGVPHYFKFAVVLDIGMLESDMKTTESVKYAMCVD